jgi:hypothetical protein
MIQNLKKNVDQNCLTPRSFIFLDLRLPDSEQDTKTGFLPMTVIFNKDELDDVNVSDFIISVG